MALFMPTNVLPSATGGTGAGCVDATQPLSVSWNVNGFSPMTAFEIVIYQNNAQSTQVYTTGKLTDGCPFYGTNYAGEAQVFTYSIPAADLLSAGIVNGGSYKLAVTLWWSANDSVTQSSASAFITRSAPVLTLDTVPDPMTGKSYTFTANYTQAQGDALDFVRWRVASGESGETILLDTGNIYGTGELACTYDGFFIGETYSVRCDVQTANGISATTGWSSFTVEYTVNDLEGVVQAECSRNSTSIYVQWPALVYSNGVGSGFSVANGLLSLPDANSYATWNERNGDAISLQQPWCVGYRGSPMSADADLLTVSTSAGDFVLTYDFQTTDLSFSAYGNLLWTQPIGLYEFYVTCMLTPGTMHIWTEQVTGLFPSATKYPSTTLYPGLVTQNVSIEIPIPYPFGTLQSVTLGGVQQADYMFINEGKATAALLQQVQQVGFSPEFGSDSYLTAPFTNGLNAGNLQGSSDTLNGLTVYRQEGTGANLFRVKDVPISEKGLYDYGVHGQSRGYRYYVFPHGVSSYLTSPMVSVQAVYPCWWVHTILQTQKQSDGTYAVVKEFWFGKNLVSGAVSNNNTPGVLHNFTPYPTVQIAPQNYKSGQLESLIGWIDNGAYGDNLALRDAIFALSTTQDTLFYKNQKGDFYPIRLSAPVSFTTADGTKEQALTASISFVQIDDGSEYSLVNPSAGYVAVESAREGGGTAV